MQSVQSDEQEASSPGTASGHVMTPPRQAPAPALSKKRRRPISVYDAVAGRVGYEGFLTEPQASKYRDLASSTAVAVPAEEILFRRRDAPVRYEEDDVYFSSVRNLTPDQRLPSSDLLKVIHAYVADFYAAAKARHSGQTDVGEASDFRSLDETALLAMGILLEEAASEVLGGTGYLALVEQSEEESKEA